MNIFKSLNKFFFSSIFILLLMTLSTLIWNTSHGLDITDESYYILVATHPNDLFSLLSQEGYYTGLLYFLSGYNLSYFRLLGIIVLLFCVAWFAAELYRYSSEKMNTPFKVIDKYLFIMVLSSSSLVYYCWWLLTPSYNWLALVSILLSLGSFLRIVNNYNFNFNKYITIDYLILSFSLSMSYMAKPTTAMVLTIIALLFVAYEHKKINLKKSLPSIFLMTLIIVTLHIVFLDGGFSEYFNRLTESMKRMEIASAGYSLLERYEDMKRLFQSYYSKKTYFRHVPKYTYSIFGVVMTILYLLRHKIHAEKIYLAIMFVLLTAYSFSVFNYAIHINILSQQIWLSGVKILLVFIGLVCLYMAFTSKKWQLVKRMLYILPLIFILILGSLAYALGTNNNIILQMGNSIVFVVAAILIWSYIFDSIIKINLFMPLMGAIFSLVSYFAIQEAYNHPYRLDTNIKEQNQYVNLLGGIYVDQEHKAYIETLQNIKKHHNTENKIISLIDMTGGTPGANVILDADFFGHPWLLGYFDTSNKLVYRILNSYANTNKLKNAWILIAPKGVVKLDLNILKKIGLNFPEDYVKIGTVKSKRRQEIQELWKPIYNE